MRTRFIFILIAQLTISASLSRGQQVQNQPMTLDFEVQPTSETDSENPFLDYRLQVTFSNNEATYEVPGYYAADGNAANTGASEGGVWRVKFTPPSPGEWAYNVSFRKGEGIAINEDPYSGHPVKEHHGKTGKFSVKKTPENAKGFRKTGHLTYNDSRYLYTRDGNPLLIYGSNSPENFLAYQDIDSTYNTDPDRDYIKSWSPHIKDWNEGDPTWKNGKGKGIIGALNYLAAKNMNAIYMLTLNIDGDARDVWPFLSHRREDFKRYDVSKLAQWDIIFSHAEKLGIVIEIITQEQENQLLLDDGYTRSERKLYYRELIARFSYHKNIIWNIGEENGYSESYPHGQNDQQRFAMIRYIKENDPYKHPLLMHTYPHEEEREKIAGSLLRYNMFDGLSMQVGNVNDVHRDISKWIESTEKRRPWIMLMDEIGPWQTGTQPDSLNPRHYKVRSKVLWPSLLAGASGIQWYFGWFTRPNDLNAEDLRSRENIWEQTANARTFFRHINYTEMNSADHLISRGSNNYCFSKPGDQYVIYLPYGGTTDLNLSYEKGNYTISWFNPRTGGKLLKGTLKSVEGGKWVNIGKAPEDLFKDWVVLVEKQSSKSIK